jgi:hypothetical protein
MGALAEITCSACGRSQALAPADQDGGVTPEQAAGLGWARTVGIRGGGWLCPFHSDAGPGMLKKVFSRRRR